MEFMRLLLCCCCSPAHPPSAQAGRSFKICRFSSFSLIPFKLSSGVVIKAGLGSVRLVSSFHRCPGFVSTNSGAAHGSSEFEQGRTTAVGLPALQLARHFSLLTQAPPLNLNTSCPHLQPVFNHQHQVELTVKGVSQWVSTFLKSWCTWWEIG